MTMTATMASSTSAVGQLHFRHWSDPSWHQVAHPMLRTAMTAVRYLSRSDIAQSRNRQTAACWPARPTPHRPATSFLISWLDSLLSGHGSSQPQSQRRAIKRGSGNHHAHCYQRKVSESSRQQLFDRRQYAKPSVNPSVRGTGGVHCIFGLKGLPNANVL